MLRSLHGVIASTSSPALVFLKSTHSYFPPGGNRYTGVKFKANSYVANTRDSGQPPFEAGDFQTWLLGGANSDYDVRLTIDTGASGFYKTFNGSGSHQSGVWYNLGTDRHYWIANGTASNQKIVYTAEIRLVAGGEILATSDASGWQFTATFT